MPTADSAQPPANPVGTESDASRVMSEVIGEVTDVLVQVGQSVRAGQALVRGVLGSLFKGR